MNKFILSVLTLALLAANCTHNQTKSKPLSNAEPVASSTPISSNAQLVQPVTNALSRVSKKPFGIYITPQTSPINPEKFKGYHTGVDFETTTGEQNVDVAVFAVCDGKLLMKKSAQGYGGVMVQSCKLDGSDVTIIYGHIKLASVAKSVGGKITAGEQIAILGKGFSSETGGERKHLHLGIHKGTAVNILGYAQNKSDLSNWLNITDYLAQ